MKAEKLIREYERKIADVDTKIKIVNEEIKTDRLNGGVDEYLLERRSGLNDLRQAYVQMTKDLEDMI